jgi:hypothetical protein
MRWPVFKVNQAGVWHKWPLIIWCLATLHHFKVCFKIFLKRIHTSNNIEMYKRSARHTHVSHCKSDLPWNCACVNKHYNSARKTPSIHLTITPFNTLYLLYDVELLELDHGTAVSQRKSNGQFDHISVEVWAECFSLLQWLFQTNL